ncbi:ABC transporter ATP-binding protein, partial [Staphylococcus gallinarum]
LISIHVDLNEIEINKASLLETVFNKEEVK